jgi:transcriptional regulator GlxA family with amidase domain
VVDWVGTTLVAELSVAALARRANVSPRTLARAFGAELGTTPGAYVEALRLDAARRLLETTDRSVEDVARSCGFGTVETMHRAFRRRLGTTPGQYRRLTA